MRHFTCAEMVVGPELEARLAKTLLPAIEPAEVARLAAACRMTSSAVIKATLHKRWRSSPAALHADRAADVLSQPALRACSDGCACTG